MKSVNFKHPKYVLPIIVLPFAIGMFWLYKSESSKAADVEVAQETVRQEQEQQVNNIQQPSDRIQDGGIQDKFAAFEDKYKRSKGRSAMQGLGGNDQFVTSLETQYTDEELLKLDSMQQVLSGKKPVTTTQVDVAPERRAASKPRSSSGNKNLVPSRNKSQKDKELEQALAQIAKQSGSTGSAVTTPRTDRGRDDSYDRQLDTFKAQMNYMDSLEKARDPKYQAMLAAKKKADPASIPTEEKPDRQTKVYAVEKAGATEDPRFNTIVARRDETMIEAIVDQNTKATLGSRIRFRLLNDIEIAGQIVRNGSYLYGRVSGFGGQRVQVQITSVVIGNKIYPIDIQVYDKDGIEGFYVPASEFREFTKELGSSSSQSINLQTDPEANQIVASLIQRMFRTTTTAASGLIRANKAKLKYSTMVYLVPQN